MQLVMRRYRLEGSLWSKFKINARMVVDGEENGLISKYNLHNVILTEGHVWRDLRISAVIAAPITAFIILILMTTPVYRLGWGGFALIFPVLCYFVYHQIREEVRVKDLLTGRDFKANSFLGLLRKEQMIRKTSAIFANVINQSRTWDEPEVIELEPLPLFTVLEGDRAAA